MKTKTKNDTKAAVAFAVSSNRELLENQHDINNVLTTAENVSPMFGGHYFNMESGEHGLQTLIAEILTEREAIFPKDSENSALRQVVISAGMFTSEIVAEVEKRFSGGTNRYKYVHAYLSVIMFKNGKIGKVKLTNNEDKPRPCFKPRCKWFLIA